LTPNSEPNDIASGPDGNLWFTEELGNQIGRITTSGTVTEYPLPHANSVPYGIASGPNQSLWFTEQTGNRIGVIGPVATPAPGIRRAKVKPHIHGAASTRP